MTIPTIPFSSVMDLSAVVVVRKISGDRFLLVEDGKRLQLPSCSVTDADAFAAAESLLEQVNSQEQRLGHCTSVRLVCSVVIRMLD